MAVDFILRKPFKVKRYVLRFAICNACPNKMACAGEANITKSKGGYIERNEYQDYVDQNIERVKNNKDHCVVSPKKYLQWKE